MSAKRFLRFPLRNLLNPLFPAGIITGWVVREQFLQTKEQLKVPKANARKSEDPTAATSQKPATIPRLDLASVLAVNNPTTLETISADTSTLVLSAKTFGQVSSLFPFGRLPSLDVSRLRFHKGSYASSVNPRMRVPDWVAERIEASDLHGHGDRKHSHFRSDASVPLPFRASLVDYAKSGYSRGHLAACSSHKNSQDAMDATFLLSANIVPQVKSLLPVLLFYFCDYFACPLFRTCR